MNQSGVNVEELNINHSKDLVSEDLRRLKMLYVNLERKYEEVTQQLR